MGIAIPIETSARHIHISEEDFQILFGKDAELTYKADLSQPGQYVCEERITVKGPRGSFENVAVLGPHRPETQVGISMTDFRKLGIKGMIRQSGDTEGTPGCTLIGPCGSLEYLTTAASSSPNGTPPYMTPVQAIQMNVKDNDEVFVIMESFERSLIFADVVVRVSPKFALAMHVDTDEANAFANDNHPTGSNPETIRWKNLTICRNGRKNYKTELQGFSDARVKKV